MQTICTSLSLGHRQFFTYTFKIYKFHYALLYKYQYLSIRMNEDSLTKYLSKYFKQPTVDRVNLARIFQFIEKMSGDNHQSQMIKKIFKVAQGSMAKDNLKVIVKRYLHIINKILQQDDGLKPQCQYCQAVSGEIVPNFITLLRNVLNYGPLEILADLKLYRKRWAKRITDYAYSMMQVEAQKQLKVDLDKGFQEDIVKKLLKSYQKRNFSKSDLEKYMPSSNVQASSTQTRKSSAINSSSSSEQQRRKNKIERPSQSKSQERVAEKRNQYKSDMVMSRHSFIPSISNSFGNAYVGDSRRLNQIFVHPQNIYPHNFPYDIPNRVLNLSVGQINPFSNSVGYFRPLPNNNYQPFSYPNYNYTSPSYQSYSTPFLQQKKYEQQNYVEPKYEHDQSFPSAASQKQNKLFYKIQSFKMNWFYECKCCGVLISTDQKYNQHMLLHFSQAQKKYQVSHTRADHSKKGSKQLMPSINNWIYSKRAKLSEQKFQVPIQGNLQRSEYCFICKGDLHIKWSDQHQNWVYEDAIRVQMKSKIINCISHADCYHTINDFQKSSQQ